MNKHSNRSSIYTELVSCIHEVLNGLILHSSIDRQELDSCELRKKMLTGMFRCRIFFCSSFIFDLTSKQYTYQKTNKNIRTQQHVHNQCSERQKARLSTKVSSSKNNQLSLNYNKFSTSIARKNNTREVCSICFFHRYSESQDYMAIVFIPNPCQGKLGLELTSSDYMKDFKEKASQLHSTKICPIFSKIQQKNCSLLQQLPKTSISTPIEI